MILLQCLRGSGVVTNQAGTRGGLLCTTLQLTPRRCSSAHRSRVPPGVFLTSRHPPAQNQLFMPGSAAVGQRQLLCRAASLHATAEELREETQDQGEEPPEPRGVTRTLCQGRSSSCSPGAELCGAQHVLCGPSQPPGAGISQTQLTSSMFLSHLLMFSKLLALVMSYTSMIPMAPL